MIVLYIILAISLFLFLLTLIPVGVDARYRNKLFCVVRIGFVKIRVYPPKPKKKKKAKKEEKVQKPKISEKEKKEEFSLKKFFKQNGVSGIINIIKKIASVASGALKDVFSHIIIRDFSLTVTITGDDASDTALNYGHTCSAVYPAVSIIYQVCNCQNFSVLVSPDFTEGAKSKAVCRVSADIKIFWLVKAVIVHGFKALQVFFKLKKAQVKEPKKNETENSSKTNENKTTQNSNSNSGNVNKENAENFNSK